MHDTTSDDLLGDFSHMHLGEGCFWLSVTNLVTIGYGSIVRRPTSHAQNSWPHMTFLFTRFAMQ